MGHDYPVEAIIINEKKKGGKEKKKQTNKTNQNKNKERKGNTISPSCRVVLYSQPCTFEPVKAPW